MSKNLFVISSSPRKSGNSDILCDEIIRGAEEAGNIAEKVRLSDKRIGYCTGCLVCMSTHVCVQKDDMAELLGKMVAADVIVIATPVYFYTMCAQLKTFIDRTVPRFGEIQGKDIYYIATMAESDKSDMERTFDGIRGFTLKGLPGAKEKGMIYGIDAADVGDIKRTSAMQEAYLIGKQI
jgi:multimeric flavodoxin WrbA